MRGFIGEKNDELVRSISGASGRNLTWSSLNQRGTLLIGQNSLRMAGASGRDENVLRFFLLPYFCFSLYIATYSCRALLFLFMAANISLVPILNCQPPRQTLPTNCFLPSSNIPGKGFTGFSCPGLWVLCPHLEGVTSLTQQLLG